MGALEAGYTELQRRFYALDGDRVVDGVLCAALDGRPKEQVYPEGVAFPILTMEDAGRHARASRRPDAALDARRRRCFHGAWSRYAGWELDALAAMDQAAVARCRAWAEAFGSPDSAGQARSLVLFGAPGVGKTSLAAATANALMAAGLRCYMTSVREIEQMAAGRFGSIGSIVAQVCSHDLVVLDDFGSERGTAWSVDQIFEVVDGMYRRGQRMLVTTNLTANQLRRPSERAEKLVRRVRDGGELVAVGGGPVEQGRIGGAL